MSKDTAAKVTPSSYQKGSITKMFDLQNHSQSQQQR